MPLLLALVIVWLLTGDYGLAWLSVAVMAGSIAGAIMFAIGVVLLIFRRITVGSLLALTLVAMLLGITFSFEEIGFGVLRNLKAQYITETPQQEAIKLGWGKKLWFSKGKGEKIFLNFDVQGKREFTRAEFYDILSNDLKKQLNRPITIYDMYSNLTDPIASHDQPFLSLHIAIHNDENLFYGGYLEGGVMKDSNTTWAVKSYANDRFTFYQYGQSGDLADGIGNFIDREEVDLKIGQQVVADKSKLKLSLNDKRELDGYIYVRGDDDQWCAFRDPLVNKYQPINSVDFSKSGITTNNVLYCGTNHNYIYQILPKLNENNGLLSVIIRWYQKAN